MTADHSSTIIPENFEEAAQQMEWENVEFEHSNKIDYLGIRTDKLVIPEGTIYRTIVIKLRESQISMLFVPGGGSGEQR